MVYEHSASRRLTRRMKHCKRARPVSTDQAKSKAAAPRMSKAGAINSSDAGIC